MENRHHVSLSQLIFTSTAATTRDPAVTNAVQSQFTAKLSSLRQVNGGSQPLPSVHMKYNSEIWGEQMPLRSPALLLPFLHSCLATRPIPLGFAPLLDCGGVCTCCPCALEAACCAAFCRTLCSLTGSHVAASGSWEECGMTASGTGDPRLLRAQPPELQSWPIRQETPSIKLRRRGHLLYTSLSYFFFFCCSLWSLPWQTDSIKMHHNTAS